MLSPLHLTLNRRVLFAATIGGALVGSPARHGAAKSGKTPWDEEPAKAFNGPNFGHLVEWEFPAWSFSVGTTVETDADFVTLFGNEEQTNLLQSGFYETLFEDVDPSSPDGLLEFWNLNSGGRDYQDYLDVIDSWEDNDQISVAFRDTTPDSPLLYLLESNDPKGDELWRYSWFCIEASEFDADQVESQLKACTVDGDPVFLSVRTSRLISAIEKFLDEE